VGKRQLLGEDEYRDRLWQEIERRLSSRGESKTDLARQWGKQKSTVTRLAEREVPTTLGNLEELADRVFDMDLAELLWLILHPEDAAQVQQQAVWEMWRTMEAVQDQFLAGLDAPNSRRVMYAVGRLASSAPADLALLADMLEATANHREQRRQQPSPLSHWAPPDGWSAEEEES